MRNLSVLACLLLSCHLMAQPTRIVPLYPNGVPDSNGLNPEDEYVEESYKFFATSEPRIDLYLPEGVDAPVPALLICPGGGYLFTSTGNEGVAVASFFVPRGYAVAVLKYRLPNGHEYIPLNDALQAMRMLRDSADVWHLQRQHIGVMGFSAGGHLASSLLTHFADSTTRPDYGVLIYPVITMDPKRTHRGSFERLMGPKPTKQQIRRWSSEKNVTADTPPCLIVACQDDKTVQVCNSVMFFDALTAQHVPASLLIVPTGGHGWGFSNPIPDRPLIEQTILSFVETH